MVLVSVAAVAIGLAVVAVALPKAAPRDELRMPPTAYDSALVNGSVLGSPAAPVTIQLYADFQCPACRLFVTTELPRLTDEFVKPGTVRIETHDIAFLGKGSFDESLELAVGAACAADQGRYWPFHDIVFWNQGRENQGDHDAAFIAQVADQAMVDRPTWDACVAADQHRDAVKAGTRQAVGAGISSTPTLVVNGERVVGVPDYDTLASLIRRQAGEPASPAAS
ncbi:MAG TPA: thioredoxin domain-containing protein [Candidatus Limnocylindrales bacterium]|jgi:protein-disulfide isomerase|nr:thioredoxin domain-containing protein [Candidatus Limnocylindrales bacterium]